MTKHRIFFPISPLEPIASRVPEKLLKWEPQSHTPNREKSKPGLHRKCLPLCSQVHQDRSNVPQDAKVEAPMGENGKKQLRDFW